MATKQPCKNHPSFTFSGKESSPLGLGYSAEAEDPGTVMEGRDKTMWMVGIRNGVKIWNRVPSQIVATVVKPMAKEEVVIAPVETKEPQPPEVVAPKKRAPPKKKQPVEAAPVQVPEPVPEVAVPKKRAPPKKKAVVIVEEPEPQPEPVEQEVKVEEKATEKKVKKAPKKKQPVEPEEGEKEKEKDKKKVPNNFNIYMSYRTDQLKREDPSLDHKQRFQQASKEWKQLDDERKKQLVEEALAWKDNQQA